MSNEAVLRRSIARTFLYRARIRYIKTNHQPRSENDENNSQHLFVCSPQLHVIRMHRTCGESRRCHHRRSDAHGSLGGTGKYRATRSKVTWPPHTAFLPGAVDSMADRRITRPFALNSDTAVCRLVTFCVSFSNKTDFVENSEQQRAMPELTKHFATVRALAAYQKQCKTTCAKEKEKVPRPQTIIVVRKQRHPTGKQTLDTPL